MIEPDAPPQSFDLCKHLRWKSQSRVKGDRAAIVESLRRNSVPFSCLHTCQPWGPDDDIVSPGCCDRSRDCFEPDPRFERHQS